MSLSRGPRFRRKSVYAGEIPAEGRLSSRERVVSRAPSGHASLTKCSRRSVPKCGSTVSTVRLVHNHVPGLPGLGGIGAPRRLKSAKAPSDG